MKVSIIYITNNSKIDEINYLLSNAYKISNDVEALLIGNFDFDLNKIACKNIINVKANTNDLTVYGISKICKNYISKNLITMLIAKQFNNELANILALDLNIPALLNGINIEKNNEIIVTKPIYSMNLIGEYKIEKKAIISLCFKKEYQKYDIKPKNIKQINCDLKNTSKIISCEKVNKNNLAEAKIVIAVGKGVNKDYIEKCKKLAKLINGEIGATRPVVYDGNLPFNCMIGSSNISISADAVIAIGIAGSAPFVSGIKNCNKVYAINKDKNALIFSNADFGFIGDSKSFIDSMLLELEGEKL